MDVLRLDTSYLPNSLVEGYTSMIWTERFLDSGEFEMKTAKVAEARALLPEGQPISLRDSKEVMVVDTLEIGVDAEGDQELTIKGLTFETFLKNRVMLAATYREKWEVLKQYTTAEMATLLIWNHLVNGSGQDPTRVGQAQDSLQALANVVATDSSTIVEAAHEWYLETGEVYQTLKNFLPLGGIGVRNVRPAGTTANVVSFDTSGGGTRGDRSEAVTANIDDLRVDVYNGLDRTRFQTDREPVIFHYDSGHIENPKYLFSIKDLKDMAYAVSSEGITEVWPDGAFTGVSGLARRQMVVDAGDKGDMDPTEFANAVVQAGRIELAKHNRQAIFDGAISPIAPYKYGLEYGLGDFVTVLANYGFNLTMMVSEYIRTEDSEGDRGYPTLVLA